MEKAFQRSEREHSSFKLKGVYNFKGVTGERQTSSTGRGAKANGQSKNWDGGLEQNAPAIYPEATSPT